MPYIDPEVIMKAKNIDLLTYLRSCEPHELVHVSGDTYSTRTHDSLKISNGKWCWWSRGIGGRSALDYLIKVNGLSFLEAIERIVGRTAVQPPVFVFPEKPKPKKLILPEAYPHTDGVEAYLRYRGIDSGIINFCLSTGRIYENHNHIEASGKTYVNAVFVGFNTDGIPQYATLRGIGSDFRGEAKGSDKCYSFNIMANQPNDTVRLFESAIDLLSYATLLKLDGRDCRVENLLSLAGVYQPKKNIEESKAPAALTQLMKDYPHIKKVALHLDNDAVGRMATKAIMTVLPKQYEAADIPPPIGKDYNDYLCLRLGLPVAKPKERINTR